MRLRKKRWALPELEENPYIYINPYELNGKWHEVFKNDQPMQLEIGTGRGEFIVELAKRNPDINYVTMDVESNIFVYAGRNIQEAQLDNLIGVLDNAENLSKIFTESDIEKIYINFCNPWPKPRQHKRRLTHPRLLNEYKKVLKEGSEIELKTDDDGLYEDSLEYFNAEGFEILETDTDLKVNENSIVTNYESKWRNLGVNIKYIRARFNG